MPDADPNASTSTARPKLGRPESELLMSYYQSSLADQGISYQPPPQQNRRAAHRRTLSGNSTSSSDYSSSSDHSLDQPKPAEATRRSSVPTQGGSDRRRLAIVEMDTVREAESPTADSAIRSRRQFESRLAGLALIAPPDASPNSYAYHAPPTSAPPTALHHPEEKGHHRSASEVTTASSKNRASRDVGIVGTTTKPLIIEPLKRPRLETVPTNESILPPVFQEPHSSRAPTPNTAPSPSLSPIVTSQLTPSVKRRSTDLSVHTPEIGQGKEIHVPVASPVVVDLGPDASLRVGNSTFERRASPALQVVEPRSAFPAQVPSSYLHYQPGLHATAGPLPPPPRAVNINPSAPPPPRPPRLHSPPPRRRRDLDVAKQGLPSVSAVLGSSTPSSSNSSRADLTNSSTSSHGHGDSGTEESQHRREGAFSPSIISTTSSTSPSDSPTTPMRSIDALIPKVNASGSNGADAGSGGPSDVVIAPPPRLESLPEQKP
ncbi:hypothetical protein C8J57DRAFT_737497 [Mycena rebaudengoi]|nr:hypothetical protein C8J57DRAFT_737497 [Mycena rebaudengoi]